MIRCFHHRYITVFLVSTLVAVCVSAQQVSVPVPDAHAQKLYEILLLVEKSGVWRFKTAQMLKQHKNKLVERIGIEDKITEIQGEIDAAIDAVCAMTQQEIREQELLAQQHEKSQSILQRISQGIWKRKLTAMVAIIVTVLAKPLVAAITAHLF